MSTFTGTPTAPQDAADLQLAPRGSKGPDFNELKFAFEKVVTDSQPFSDQCAANFSTRFALWNGQSSDGKKHARAGHGQPDVIPWDGASDLRVYLTDDAVCSMNSMFRMAFRRATLVANPVEASDSKRAAVVSSFMRWLIHTQIPNVDREIKLLANYVNEKGVGALGAFWETKQEKTLLTLTLQELQGRLPNFDVMALLIDPEGAETIAAVFEEQYGINAAQARKAVRELADQGKSTIAAVGREISRPILRAFNLDEQLFIPPDTTDLETASGIYRVEYFTPEQLRGFVHTDNWDSDWVESAIQKCRGLIITLSQSEFQQPIARSFVYQQQKQTNKVGVVFAYQRLSDEDGVPGIYCTKFNPSLPPEAGIHKGYAKYGLSEYAHGQYPFTLFRREHLSRRLHDTRGMPEPGKSWQDAIKAHKDSRIDAASISIIPPFGYPAGRPPGRYGPGARIPERRPGEFHFLEKLHVDGLTEASEELLRQDFKAYFGFLSKEGDPIIAQTKLQDAVDDFLFGLSQAFSQLFNLYQQYGDDEVTFRVIGLRSADALTFIKGDPQERFDFILAFDTQSADFERMEKKWAAVLAGIQALNSEGNVNFAEAIQAYVESIDPNIAERILDPTDVGRARVVEEEQNDLAQIFAGINKNVNPNRPPQLALEVIQNYVQGSPDVQQRMQSDQAFRERLEARVKQYQMGISQMQNKQIGRMGALMPGPTMQ